MSWAAHDVEGWSLVCRNAIYAAIGLEPDSSLEDALVELERHVPVWDALMQLAAEHIDAATADYFLRRWGPAL